MPLCDARTQPGYGAIRIQAGGMCEIGLMEVRTGFPDAQHFLGGVPLHAMEVDVMAPSVAREPGRRHVPARRDTGAAAPSRETR